MLSQSEQAIINLEQARDLRALGVSYREIGRKLALTSSQLGRIRRVLSRAKASRSRLRSANPNATDRDLPVAQSALPSGLRQQLQVCGYHTLGDLADSLADPDFAGLETLAGIGPHRARLIKGVLDYFGLLPGSDDLQGVVEALFPEFRDGSSGGVGQNRTSE